ncbi:hypothetical protein [Streptomyces avidinii]
MRHGKDPAHARAWVARSDEPNARLVGLGRHRADLVLDAGYGARPSARGRARPATGAVIGPVRSRANTRAP